MVEVSVTFDERRGYVAKSACRAPGRSREEVDRVFGPGHAAEHPELVVAIVHAASSDWAARVICAALEDTPRRNAGRSRSLAPVFNPWLSARSTPRLLDSLRLRLLWRLIAACRFRVSDASSQFSR